jgi:hypothetical protein
MSWYDAMMHDMKSCEQFTWRLGDVYVFGVDAFDADEDAVRTFVYLIEATMLHERPRMWSDPTSTNPSYACWSHRRLGR